MIALRTGSRSLWRLVWAALFGSIVVELTVLQPCAGQQTVTAPSGAAVGRDIVDSTVNIGIPSEQLPGIVEAATKDWRDLSDQQKQTIGNLQDKLGVNENALKAFFATLGENEVPIEQLTTKLAEIAENYKDALAQAAQGPNDPPQIAKVKNEVKAALQAGQLDRGDQLLAQLEKLPDAAPASMQLKRWDLSAQRGKLAMSQLRYRDAASHFAEAAAHVPEQDTNVRLGYLDQEAEALYREAHGRSDDAALKQSIEIWRLVLQKRPRERVPLQWAMTQNNLGMALERLGQRESSTADLTEAVAAYRAALQERPRERLPLQWATTQNNLGNALRALGELESGTVHLTEAVAAYRAALEERPRERVPFEWAMTQSNLGSALRALGERESDAAQLAHLTEAVAAIRAALEEFTRDGVPLQWAATQDKLGTVLVALGERESGTGRLGEAVAAYRAALGERTRDRVPLLWAQSQYGLANALAAVAERKKDPVSMMEALTCMRNAAGVFQEAKEGYWLPIAQRRIREMEGELTELQRTRGH